MSILVSAHYDTDDTFGVKIKSDTVGDFFPYHVVKINGKAGNVALFLSVEQMIVLFTELKEGIQLANQTEDEFNKLKEDVQNG